jgi:GNAT superfamily N-acetyltransferase
MHIRPATPGDAGRISALILGVSHTFTLHPDGRGAEEFLTRISPEGIAGYLASPAYAYLVAEEEGALAGVVGIRDHSHLFHLFVHPAFQRRGLSRGLWNAAMAAALRGGNPGEFTVNSSPYAIPVYQRFGFEATGPRVEQDGIAFTPMKLVVGPGAPPITGVHQREEQAMDAEPSKEHQWLRRLVGEWTFEMEAEAGPGEPPITDSGTELVRPLGDAWVLCEAGAATPGGGSATSIMSIGYDPDRQRFQGTFISSMMAHLWIYEGRMDAAGGVLALDTEGPSYTGDATTARYRDTIEITSDGGRVQTSSYQRADGTWHRFMTTRYRRTR